MSSLQSQQVLRKRGDRHVLLLQQRFNEMVFWPSVLLIAVCGVLLIWTPAQLESYRLHLTIIIACAGLIVAMTFGYRLSAYAQCRDKGLRIQVPFYHVTIPYEELLASRPTDYYRMFPPKKMRWLQRGFMRPLLGKTVVVVDLEQLPRSRSWLRLWLSRFMLCPDREGIVLPVRDWIAFRTELDDFRSRNRKYHY